MLNFLFLLITYFSFSSAFKFPIEPNYMQREKELHPVPSLEDCGSSGVLHGVWAEDCRHDPCQVIPNNDYLIRVEFTPEASHEHITLVIYAIIGAPIPVLEEKFEGPFQGKIKHRIEYLITVPDMFRGKKINLRAVTKNEFCVNFSLHILDQRSDIIELPRISNVKITSVIENTRIIEK